MRIKSVKPILGVIVALLFLYFILPGAVFADSVTDNIGVYIGYFGWNEEEYVEKASYHWSDLDDRFGGALDTKTRVYTYYSGKRTYLAAARGFAIRDLMEHAGVDMNSISRLDFFTKDQTVGAYRSFTKYSLFDMPRYYYPNLAANEASGELYAWNGNNIMDGAICVEPVLALEDYTEWDAVGSEFEKFYDSTMFSPSSRFHLFFGQAEPKEANTSSAAKYVYKILVTFSGAPVLTTEQPDLELKVGTDFQVSVQAEAEDALLNEYVARHLKWSSSDESVAEVDSNGKLKVKKDGVAVITASFGKSTISVPVKVGDGAVQKVSTGAKSAKASVSPGTLEQETKKGKAANSSEKTVYELSSSLMSQKEYAQWVQRVLKNTKTENQHKSSQSQESNTGMGKDAQQLLVALPDQPKVAAVACSILAVFFLTGFGFGILRFRYGLNNEF